MAIYHCSVKTISRSQGRSSVASSAYRSGENLYNEYDGITHDYTHKTGVEHTEIILCENAPQEYANRQFLWNQVEKSENRKDSRTAREIEIALPIELNKSQQIELVREYVKENFTSKGMIADIAIHNKKDGNPHAHIMLTTRNINENGFLNKNRNWDKKENLIEWRKSWEQIHNKHVEKAGYVKKNEKHDHAFIDHRSHESRGLAILPTKHIGVVANALKKRGIATKKGDINIEILKHNKKINDLIKNIKLFEKIKSMEISMNKSISPNVENKKGVMTNELTGNQRRNGAIVGVNGTLLSGTTTGNEKIKRSDEILHNREYGQKHDTATGVNKRIGWDRESKSENTKSDEFDFDRAKSILSRARKENAGATDEIQRRNDEERRKTENKLREKQEEFIRDREQAQSKIDRSVERERPSVEKDRGYDIEL